VWPRRGWRRVDTTHVLTNGFSYGGGMSYELACARAKVFRAAAIYEGAQLSGCDGGNDPIALWPADVWSFFTSL
jgi:poly(3-hydroxybutyrate) depolymerase